MFSPILSTKVFIPYLSIVVGTYRNRNGAPHFVSYQIVMYTVPQIYSVTRVDDDATTLSTRYQAVLNPRKRPRRSRCRTVVGREYVVVVVTRINCGGQYRTNTRRKCHAAVHKSLWLEVGRWSGARLTTITFLEDHTTVGDNATALDLAFQEQQMGAGPSAPSVLT
jgi:hypothetical protein